jgi:hypothetical protein
VSQIQDGCEKVIAYGSRKLSKSERNYCVTRRELLAIVVFIKQFRHYLMGRPFTVRTDHNSLRWLFSFKDPDGQVARWLERLSMFEFDIQHRPGVKHGNSDAMSRIPCDLHCKYCMKGHDEDMGAEKEDRKARRATHRVKRGRTARNRKRGVGQVTPREEWKNSIEQWQKDDDNIKVIEGWE